MEDKKLADELSDLWPKLELYRQTKTAEILQKFFTKIFFLLKVLIEIHCIVFANFVFNFYIFLTMHTRRQTYKNM